MGLLLLPGATGCYVQVPVWEGAPPPGQEITLSITERGRSELAAQLGPGVRRVAGRLAALDDSVYIIDVSSVEYVHANDATRWNRERVRVGRDYVGGVTERRLSRSRSWLTAGVALASVLLVSAIAIEGFGGDGGNTRPRDDGGGQTQ